MEIAKVKSSLGQPVKYRESDYIFSGCILRKNSDGVLTYQAEIKDVQANSIIICRLEDINREEG